MVYSLGYRRPPSVQSGTSSSQSLTTAQKKQSIDQSIKSGSSCMSSGIPEALSFDSIISGGTCPPCTTRDFMNYLKYIELAPENLQFYLWFRDYCKRFESLPESEKVLSPEWTVAKSDALAANAQAQKSRTQQPISNDAAAIFKDTDFASTLQHPQLKKEPSINPFQTPRPSAPRSEVSLDSDDSAYPQSKAAYSEKAKDTFTDVGVKLQPFTVQPYREELTRIITIYIGDKGSRQLNLSSKERVGLLNALAKTTHPSAFRDVITTVEWSLRHQAHPNFIRWTICNGNRPRVTFARGLGIGGILIGIVTGIVLCLSSASRAWRVFSFLGFLIGISTLIAALKGMCVVLHGMHHRHLRPWELFSADDTVVSETSEKQQSFDSLASSNSWEDEPWIPKYQKRNVIRKIFDREVWIQEPALRQIQDTIFLQAILGAVIIGGVATGIFCAVPPGNFF